MVIVGILHGGQWRHLSPADNWDSIASLKYTTSISQPDQIYTDAAPQQEYVYQSSVRTHLFECTGNELRLLDCDNELYFYCLNYYAAVICKNCKLLYPFTHFLHT